MKSAHVWNKQNRYKKLPYRWSWLPFLSFLLLPIITLAKLTRHDLYKDNHQATSTRIKEKTCQAVKLSSCEVVLQLETHPAGSFAERLFASLVVLLCTLLISLLKKLLKIHQKIHNQDNRIWKRYLFFHWHDYVIHYSEVSKPNNSLFTFNLNPLFIIHYSASTHKDIVWIVK